MMITILHVSGNPAVSPQNLPKTFRVSTVEFPLQNKKVGEQGDIPFTALFDDVPKSTKLIYAA